MFQYVTYPAGSGRFLSRRYLARNTFGHMAWGLALLEPDGKFMTSEARSFHEEWKKECAGRSGQDIAKSIQWIKS